MLIIVVVLLILLLLLFIYIQSWVLLFAKENKEKKRGILRRYLLSLAFFLLWTPFLLKEMYESRDPLLYILFLRTYKKRTFYLLCLIVRMISVAAFFSWSRHRLTSCNEIWGRRIYLAFSAIIFSSILLLDGYNRTYYLLKPDADILTITESHEEYPYYSFNDEDNTRSEFLVQAPYPVLDSDLACQTLAKGLVEHVYEGGGGLRIKKLTMCSLPYLSYHHLNAGIANIAIIPEPLGYLFKPNSSEMKYTRIARVPFVFIVNSQNPVNSLSTTQLQDIYSGKINDWSSVGGEFKQILSFQQYSETFSYSMMKNRVMQGTEVEVPLRRLSIEKNTRTNEYYFYLARVDYRNYENALGYTLLPHVWAFIERQEVKALTIDGVPAVWDTFMDGSYPYMVDIYAVTRTDEGNENVERILDWLVSEEGQSWLRESGYIPIY